MKKRHIAIVLGTTYLALWGLTVFRGDRWLRDSAVSEAEWEWRYFRVKGDRRYARDSGPRVAVLWVSYPAPFVVRAEVERTIGGFNGKGSVSLYVVTPWRCWPFFERITWLS